MENKRNISERELAIFLKKGSAEAFGLVYQLYAKRLLSYIAAATRNKEDAEEIVQDIFLSLWKNHEHIDIETSISTLLFSIAYRRRIDFFRRSLKAPIYEDYMLFQNELVSEEACPLEYNDFCDLFNAALSHLPSRLQSLLVLSRIKGLSNEEIATQLNIAPKTVKNGISLGLKLLKDQLIIIRKNRNI